VPLSEEELRLLEQMERALVADDPKLASTLRGTRMRRRARHHLALGILVFVVGVTLLMSGAILQNIPVGVLGFVVMLGSAYWTLTSWRGQETTSFEEAVGGAGDPSGLRVIQGGKAKRGRSPKQGSMMERFEERWRRRKEQNGGF
jgi:hypothetical protein